MSITNFYGSQDVRAIEVQLFFTIVWYLQFNKFIPSSIVFLCYFYYFFFNLIFYKLTFSFCMIYNCCKLNYMRVSIIQTKLSGHLNLELSWFYCICNTIDYRIRPNYRTYLCKRTLKHVRRFRGTSRVLKSGPRHEKSDFGHMRTPRAQIRQIRHS